MPRLYNKWLPWKLRETQDKSKVWNHYLECPWPTFSNSWFTLFGQALCCWGGGLKQHMLHKQMRNSTVSEEIQPNQLWALLWPSPSCSLTWIPHQMKCRKASRLSPVCSLVPASILCSSVLKMLCAYLMDPLKKLCTFYWRIITLQTFAVFCQTSTWISHRYTYIPSFWTSLPTPSPSTPLGWYRVHVEFPGPYSKFPLAIYFTCGNMFPCYPFHTFHPLFPSPHAHKSILYVYFSTVAL